MRILKISSASLVVAAAGFALAACSDRLIEEAPPLGGSVAQNAAAQIVDPVPESTEVAPPLNGERNNVAQKRYEKNRVIRPRNSSTTKSLNTGGTGGSGNNSGN